MKIQFMVMDGSEIRIVEKNESLTFFEMSVNNLNILFLKVGLRFLRAHGRRPSDATTS